MYERERAWSDQFNDEVRRIVGAQLMEVACAEDDMRHNTDFFVVRCAGKRVASRMRRIKYFVSYREDFTIRTRRYPDSPRTEWDKLVEGWGDWLFYGYGEVDDRGPRICNYRIADLHVLRREHAKDPSKFQNVRANGDGSTAFLAIKWAAMPGDFIIASSKTWPTPQQVAKAQMQRFQAEWDKKGFDTKPKPAETGWLF